MIPLPLSAHSKAVKPAAQSPPMTHASVIEFGIGVRGDVLERMAGLRKPKTRLGPRKRANEKVASSGLANPALETKLAASES